MSQTGIVGLWLARRATPLRPASGGIEGRLACLGPCLGQASYLSCKIHAARALLQHSHAVTIGGCSDAAWNLAMHSCACDK
eukprot:2787397-Karenia_brevis.AAC.1